MKTKSIHLLIVSLAVMTLPFVSCTKLENESFTEAKELEIVNETDAIENFTIALSQAACQHQEVRDLIKAESLKKFDNDYDVLYQNVKNREISGLGTFRDVLISYMSGESAMESIERLLPGLTIYVTDVRWFDPEGFCAERWDTNDQRMAVTYDIANSRCEKLFSNGYYLGKIEAGTIPGGPVLIVKKNERIITSAATKSGDVAYYFKDDAFNGSLKNTIETKNNDYPGEYSTGWVDGQTAQNSSDDISISKLEQINPDIMDAYYMFRNHSYALHNDYIFYGLTGPSDKGALRTDVRSKIVRFKIAARSFDAIFDDPNDSDRNFEDSFEVTDGGQGYDAQPSLSTIYSKLWADGALEIRVRVLALGDNGQAGVFQDFCYNVKASDLFTVKSNSILREQWWSTPFKWYINWRYSMKDNKRDETTLAEKWYYPENSPFLPTWDLINNSAYNIMVLEEDSGAVTTHTLSNTYKRANQTTNKISSGLEVGGEIVSATFKNELGWSSSDEETIATETTVSYSNDDEVLVIQPISYSDKYVKAQEASMVVKVYSYESDNFTFTILPYRY